MAAANVPVTLVPSCLRTSAIFTAPVRAVDTSCSSAETSRQRPRNESQGVKQCLTQVIR